MIYTIYIFLLMGVSKTCLGVSPDFFFPFGDGADDTEFLSANDDSSVNVPFDFNGRFVFYNRFYKTVYVNNNGLLSFVSAVSTFTPKRFPLSNAVPVIAPFWADVDTRGIGNVWYRQTMSIDMLIKVKGIVAKAFPSHPPFNASEILFIATWNESGYYASHTDKTNTFQCILASDGFSSYVIFMYANNGIQWTTGDASGGTNGLGGIPAQAGFDAGNLKDFTLIEGSFTSDIINIDNKSNVDWPGLFVFQVNNVMEQAAQLVISPWYGHIFGGVTILVSGPTFKEVDVIHCMFDGIEVEGVYISEEYATCVSPRMYQTIEVPFMLKINNSIYESEAVFYPLSLEDIGDVNITSDRLLYFQGDNISITWDPSAILKAVGSVVEIEDIVVDIKLLEIDPNTEAIEEIGILASEVPNNGSKTVYIEGLDLSDTELCQVSIFIQAKRATNSQTKRAIPWPRLGSILLRAGLWSLVFYVTASGIGRSLCDQWASTEPTSVGQEILRTVRREFPCPPTFPQALAENSDLQRDNHLIGLFHPGASNCFRQRDGTERRTGGYGNQCCYDRIGNIIVGPSSGGTVDKIAPSKGKIDHFKEDVIPYILCCWGLFKNCRKYYERRPSDDGTAYNPPIPAFVRGDPHVVTLDLYKYTFNGKGEFVLIQTINNSFTVQGRMIEATNNVGRQVPATVFSAIVAKQDDSDTVQFELYSEQLIALVNGRRIDFDILKEQRFRNVTIYDLGNDTLTASFSKGEFLKIVKENGFLSVIILSLPRSFMGKTQGLMGSFDGDVSNDLTPKGGRTPLPLNSTIQTIHEKFGITWIISNSSDSLFTYLIVQDWATFYYPEFTPIYEMVFNDSYLKNNASNLCGEDEFCLFDVAATGRLEIGESTLQGGLNFLTLVELSRPIICDPPCTNGACVANDTCSCSEGYEGRFCDTIVYSECDQNLCENGGACRFHAGSYICECSSNYSGEYCEKRITNVPAIVGGVIGGFIFIVICVILICFAAKKYHKNTLT